MLPLLDETSYRASTIEGLGQQVLAALGEVSGKVAANLRRFRTPRFLAVCLI
jgi:hypothetical protein